VLCPALALLLAAPAALADHVEGEETIPPEATRGDTTVILSADVITSVDIDPIPYLGGFSSLVLDSDALTFADRIGDSVEDDQALLPGLISPANQIDQRLIETDLAHLGQPAACPADAPCAPKPPALAPSEDSAASGPDYGRRLLPTVDMLPSDFGAVIEYAPGQVVASGALQRDGLYVGPDGYIVFEPIELLQDFEGPDFVVAVESDEGDPRPDRSAKDKVAVEVYAWHADAGQYQLLGDLSGYGDFSSQGLAYHVFDLAGQQETDQLLFLLPWGPDAELGQTVVFIEAMQPNHCCLECGDDCQDSTHPGATSEPGSSKASAPDPVRQPLVELLPDGALGVGVQPIPLFLGAGPVIPDAGALSLENGVEAEISEETSPQGPLDPVNELDRSLIETDLAELGKPASCPAETPCDIGPPAEQQIAFDPGGFSVLEVLCNIKGDLGPDFVVVTELVAVDLSKGAKPVREEDSLLGQVMVWHADEGSYHLIGDIRGEGDFQAGDLAYHVFELGALVETDRILVVIPDAASDTSKLRFVEPMDGTRCGS